MGKTCLAGALHTYRAIRTLTRDRHTPARTEDPLHCPVEILERGVHCFRGSPVEEILAAKVVFVSLRIQALVGDRAWRLLRSKPASDIACNVMGDIALQHQDV